MVRITPEEAAEKFARRLSGATEDIRRGIARVRQAPGEAAAAQQDKMLAKTTEAITSGKWASRTRSVSLASWQTAATEKGIPRIAQGVESAKPKMATFFRELFPAVEAAQSRVASMPSTTLEDNIQRMTTYAREMAKFKRS